MINKSTYGKIHLNVSSIKFTFIRVLLTFNETLLPPSFLVTSNDINVLLEDSKYGTHLMLKFYLIYLIHFFLKFFCFKNDDLSKFFAKLLTLIKLFGITI